jgi:hypothetical protein
VGAWLSTTWFIVLLAAALTLLARRPLADFDQPAAGLGTGAQVMLLALLVALVTHELGHVAGGRAVGFRLVRWQIGPLEAVRSGGRWRPRLTARGLAGGHVAHDPVTPDRLRGRHAFMTACGPGANVALLGATLAAALTWGGLPLWLAVVAIAALLQQNLVPFVSGTTGRWSDGLWLWSWLVRPDRATQVIAVGAVQLASRSGVRPLAWDGRWADLAAGAPAPAADAFQAVGHLLAYARALDEGDVERAAAELAHAGAGEDAAPFGLRQAVAVERAFFAAAYRREGELAARLLERAGRPARALAADAERALAAVLLASGRPDEAVAACDSALASLAGVDQPNAGVAVMNREQVLALRSEALRALGRAAG